MHALYDTNVNKDPKERALDLDKMAQYYGKWINSHPFDIG